MKILHLTPSFWPNLGGVETHVQQIAKVHAQQGHQVTIVTQHSSAKSFQKNFKEFKVVSLTINNQSGLKINYKLEIWRKITKLYPLFLDADVIQVHDVMWWLLPLLPLVWYKTYLTFHGWEGQFPVPFRYKLVRKIWAMLATGTVHVGAYIAWYYWDKPNLVIYGGVNKTVINTYTMAKKNYSHKKIINITFLGRLEAVNEVSRYIKLLNLLAKDCKLNVTWVGDGVFKDECGQLGKVTGMVEYPAVYLRSADLVLASSYLSILEAQALGKIVIAIYSQPLKKSYLEFFPGAKMMLIGDDEIVLAKKTLILLNNHSLRTKYAHQVQQWAKAQTWEKVADQYLQLWQTHQSKIKRH